ncbi:NDP-sugar synthase [Haloparvum alkalitolerans]|uniref:sugar phosphate nucleotidyltransferase n=1 Tax=Haloparvum alkalitolerans TaxID=1042953 RepID=UPI003CEEC51B
MDAIVLAGGYATRLWPVTTHRPKMFLPLGDSTVIDRIFAELEEDDRVDDVYVSTNERFAGEFREYLAAADFEKPALSIEDTTGESEKFGVISALAQLVDREEISDDTVVIAGDNYISFDVSDFLDFFQEAKSPTIAAYDVGSRDRATSYGVVELEGDRIVDFAEKPEHPKSSLVSIACYGFPSDSIDLLETYLEEGNNPDEPGWFVQWLQDRTPTHAFTFDGAWFDIGTAESYLDAVEYELDGEALVADEATVENTSIGSGVQVLGDAVVRDSDLARTVIFPETEIANASVSESIIDRKSTVDGVDLHESLIGQHSQLEDPDTDTAPETTANADETVQADD